MSERRTPSRSTLAGKRGRHKHATSPETRNAEHRLPPRPPWMDDTAYRMLARLRQELDEA